MGVTGVAPAIIIAAATTVAVALSGCSSAPPAHAKTASTVRPSAAVLHPAQPTHSPSAMPRPTHSARPTAAATTAPPKAVATQPSVAPAAQPQPTHAPQQDCYAEPDPTCTVPPPPSSMMNSPYTTAPTSRPSPITTITESQ
jgi:hypothetical protein